MKYIVTNMEENEDPRNENVFIIIDSCDTKELRDELWRNIVLYYALYNHKKIKVATFKEQDFKHSNEFKKLKVYFPNIENSLFIKNLGYKNSPGNYQDTLPVNKRMLSTEEQNQLAEHYAKLKWVNELNWK